MFAKALLSTTAFAAAASAYLPNMQARQTGPGTDFNEQCQSAMMHFAPLYNALPTPPPVIVTATGADPCATPDLSGTELSQYESYTSAANDWVSSNSAAFASALEECAELTQYAALPPVCTGPPAQPTESPSEDPNSSSGDDNSNAEDGNATDTPSDTDTDSDGDSSSNAEDGNVTEIPGAASRETGMVAGAVVVAVGVLGFLL